MDFISRERILFGGNVIYFLGKYFISLLPILFGGNKFYFVFKALFSKNFISLSQIKSKPI